jgi:hypothetical protein
MIKSERQYRTTRSQAQKLAAALAAARKRVLSRWNNTMTAHLTATTGRTQVTSDGLAIYTHGVPMHLGRGVADG